MRATWSSQCAGCLGRKTSVTYSAWSNIDTGVIVWWEWELMFYSLIHFMSANALLTNALDVIDFPFFTLCVKRVWKRDAAVRLWRIKVTCIGAERERDRKRKWETASVLLQEALGSDTQHPTESRGHTAPSSELLWLFGTNNHIRLHTEYWEELSLLVSWIIMFHKTVSSMTKHTEHIEAAWWWW